MRILLRVVVVVLMLLVVVADKNDDKFFDCCNSVLSAVCPHECPKCPFNKNPIARMRTMLKERVFGQDDALNTIITAFKAHEKTKPLTFHFAGDNAVGKGLTVKTIAEALFKNGNVVSSDFDGFLYLRGDSFSGLEKTEEYRQTIRNQIIDQLKKCPNSLIVFDEVELLSPQTISVISSFLDDSISTFQCDDKTKCTTNEAIFIVMSDFGNEGKTESMSFQEVKTLVERDSRKYWTIHKHSSLLNYIVPFMTLGTTARKQILHYYIQHLIHRPVFADSNILSISLDNDVDEIISTLSNDAFPFHNGRSIYKYIDNYVLPQIASSLEHYDNDHNKQQIPGKMMRVLHVGTRKPLPIYYKVQFDIKVEEVLVKENNNPSFWERITGSSKSEL